MAATVAGVDPNLEGDLWTSFHALFVPEIIRLLNPLLLPHYIALAQKYHVIDSPDQIAIAPDTTDAEFGSACTYPHLCIDISDVKTRELVAAIEIMSPANKRGRGRQQYLRKRQRLLLSSAHSMEIDLLRSGHRVPIVQPLPPAAYYVLLSRADRRPMIAVWPIQPGERLPTVAVPLQHGDADVPLDLQIAYSNAYELGGFAALAGE